MKKLSKEAIRAQMIKRIITEAVRVHANLTNKLAALVQLQQAHCEAMTDLAALETEYISLVTTIDLDGSVQAREQEVVEKINELQKEIRDCERQSKVVARQIDRLKRKNGELIARVRPLVRRAAHDEFNKFRKLVENVSTMKPEE